MATRYYSNVAPPTTLTAGINAITTTITIASAAGLPPFQPFTLAIDPNTPSMELVEVTAAAGTTLTVTRAIDGTSATLHNAGAVVQHVSSARDFSEANTHINTSTNVHGLSGGAAVVGTTQLQTLTNKTLTSPTINTPTITGGTATNQTITTNQRITGTNGADITAPTNFPAVRAKAAVGQAVDIFQVQDSASNNYVIVDPNGLTRINAGATINGGPNLGSDAVIIAQGSYGSSTSTLSVRTFGGVEQLGVYNTEITTGIPFNPASETASGAGVFAVAAGWSLNSALAVKRSGNITISIIVQRTGANIVAGAGGDITDSLLGTISASWRPHSFFNASDFGFLAQNSIGSGAANLATNTGNLTLRSWNSSATISTGNNIALTMSYVA